MNKNSKVAYHSIIPQRVLQTLWNLVPCVQYGNLTNTYADLFSILPTPFATRLTRCIVFQVHGFCDFEAFRRASSFSLLRTNASNWYYFYLRRIWWGFLSHTLVSNKWVVILFVSLSSESWTSSIMSFYISGSQSLSDSI